MFKPDWSPAYLHSVMYVGRGLAIRKALFWRLGGMRDRFDGAQDYDLVLRASRAARRIRHFRASLYHRRDPELSCRRDARAGAHRTRSPPLARRSPPGRWTRRRPSRTAFCRATFRLRRPLEPAAAGDAGRPYGRS